ncbi:MAG: hypothetical protein AAB874_01670 [Patescibacteria group bacterium]
MAVVYTSTGPSNPLDEITKPLNTPATSLLTPYMEDFLKHLDRSQITNRESAEGTFKVSEVLGSIARLYERIRNIVEYKSEHVLRRNAIERILKRLLWENAGQVNIRVAESLLRELIWARYVPNDSLPKSKSTRVLEIINKYLRLLKSITANPNSSSSHIREWVWGVASAEIEEAIDPSYRIAYIELMYAWFNAHFTWQDTSIPSHEKEIQLYLAIHRALTKSDEEIMRYHLLVKEVPDWLTSTQTQTESTSTRFNQIYTEIEKHLNFKQRFLLYRIVQKSAAPFEVLRQLVIEHPDTIRKIVNDKALFEEKINEICTNRYALIKKKVNRGIFRSIIYIFLTKVVLALLIEIPYE